MQKNSYIDIYKSIESGNLKTISKKGIFDYIELILSLLFFASMALVLCFMIETELKIQTLPDKIFSFLLMVLLTLTIYGTYRKIIENKLSYVEHNLTKTNIKRIILNHLSDFDKKSITETEELLIGNRIRSYYQVTYTFIITKDKIYYNIKNHFSELNPPIFFAHLFLKRDLQKLIKQTGPNKNINP